MKTIEITCQGETSKKKAILHLTYEQFLEEIKNLTDEEADSFFGVCQEVADRRQRRSKAILRTRDMLNEITIHLSVILSQISLLPQTAPENDAEYPLDDEERAYSLCWSLQALDNLKIGLKTILAVERAYINGDDEALKEFIRLTDDEEEADEIEEEDEEKHENDCKEQRVFVEDLDLITPLDEDEDPYPDPIAA